MRRTVWKVALATIIGVAPLVTVGGVAGAGTTSSLLLAQGTAFGILGHSCGGIQEKAYATGFDPASGTPVGDVYLQTRCGGSGRGGGYHVTTYSAWVGAVWDFTATVVSTTRLATAPVVDPSFSAFDANGNQIYNSLNQAHLTLADGFVAPPRVTGVSVVTGPASGGTSVTITGTGLTGASLVDFGSTAAASFTVNGDTSISAVSPLAAAGTVDVTVTTAGGTSASTTSDQFTFVAAPSVSGVSPNSGPVSGGTSVTITGAHLTAATTVSFGGTATGFTVNDDSSITADSPVAESPDSVDVTVTTIGGTSSTNVADQFTYTSASVCSGTCVSVGDSSMLEGDSGTRVMTFPVTLSAPATSTVTVPYAVTDWTATGASAPGVGVDFKTTSGTVTFTPSLTTGLTPVTKSVSVTIYGDTTPEPDEVFLVALSSPTGGGVVLGRDVGVGTILNDDPGSGISLGIGDASIVEGNSGTGRNLVFRVTVSSPATSAVSAHFTVNGDTATYGKTATGTSDFGGASSGTIAFPLLASGQTALVKTISIPIWADTRIEPDETFTITLDTPNGPVTITRAVGTGTIVNDD